MAQITTLSQQETHQEMR